MSRYTALFVVSMVVLLLWQMLAPGYVLSLDLIFTPTLRLPAHELMNSLPLWYVLVFFNTFLPGWVVEKLLLIVLAALLSYIPLRFLPFIEEGVPRYIAALFFAANPFVYERFLAGQWGVLFGYSLMPWWFSQLMSCKAGTSLRTWATLGLTLALMALFSVHLFVISLVVTALWILIQLSRSTLRGAGISMIVLALLCSYWILPALLRQEPLEAHFTTEHFSSFAAAPHEWVPTLLNVASLHGFWAESGVWALYFDWAQDVPLFWVAWGMLVIVMSVGVWQLYRMHPKETLFLLGIGVMALVCALGAGETLFAPFNLWLYTHVPFWSGLRDSHKFVALLALVYAVFFGVGVSALLRLTVVRWRMLATSSLALIPTILGWYVWGGMHHQLQSVWYPSAWEEAKSLLESTEGSGQVLVLPWHGYMSFAFANYLLLANPARQYFGDYILQSESVEVGDVREQSLDVRYQALEQLLTSATSSDVIARLRDFNITHILYFTDTDMMKDSLRYPWLDDPAVRLIYTHEDIKVFAVSGQ